MSNKYKGWTIFERYAEYARLKSEWFEKHGWNQKEYDIFIDRIVKELRI